MKKMKISIILPTYNEGENIIELINRISTCIENKKEIIVVDDNSPDGTAQCAVDHFSNNPDVKIIVRKDERGLTTAIQRGINEATGDIIVWMDCDLSMPPEKIPELIYSIEENHYDAAVGSRFVKGGGDERSSSGKVLLFIHKSLSKLLTSFTSLLLSKDFKDWTSGFIAIKSSIIKENPLSGDYGEYFINLMSTIINKNYKIIEIPYICIPRERGESKTATHLFGFFTRGLKYVHCILKLKMKKA